LGLKIVSWRLDEELKLRKKEKLLKRVEKIKKKFND
jgi:hypothetical protein